MLNDFLSRGENIMTGTVKRLDKGDIIVESGPRRRRACAREMIPKENLRVGRPRARVHRQGRSHRSRSADQLSRTRPSS
jgi:N utilization substance protein A